MIPTEADHFERAELVASLIGGTQPGEAGVIIGVNLAAERARRIMERSPREAVDEETGNADCHADAKELLEQEKKDK